MSVPAVSIVIASGAGGEFLFRCLDSRREQAAAHDAEVIVVDRCGRDTAARIERDYWFVALLRAEVDHRPSVPHLRMWGSQATKGDLIAIIEEHCLAGDSWLRKALAGHMRADYGAVGGPVWDNGYKGLRDWVVYFCEYNGSLRPAPDGEVRDLNGANIAYRRQLLEEHYAHFGLPAADIQTARYIAGRTAETDRILI